MRRQALHSYAQSDNKHRKNSGHGQDSQVSIATFVSLKTSAVSKASVTKSMLSTEITTEIDSSVQSEFDFPSSHTESVTVGLVNEIMVTPSCGRIGEVSSSKKKPLINL